MGGRDREAVVRYYGQVRGRRYDAEQPIPEDAGERFDTAPVRCVECHKFWPARMYRKKSGGFAKRCLQCRQVANARKRNQ